MLDAKNVISSLFSSTIKEEASLDAAVDLQDEENDALSSEAINPFIALMTQVLSDESVKDTAKNSDIIENTEMQTAVSEQLQLPIIEEFSADSSDSEPVLQLDDNVAMTWINSEHYQPVLSQSSTENYLTNDAATNPLEQASNLTTQAFDGELSQNQLTEIDKFVQNAFPELGLESTLSQTENATSSEGLPSEAVAFFNELSERSEPIQISLDATELPASDIDIGTRIGYQQAYLQKKAMDESSSSPKENEALSAADKSQNSIGNNEALLINNEGDEKSSESFNQNKNFNAIQFSTKNEGASKTSALLKPESLVTETQQNDSVAFRPELSNNKADFIKDGPLQSLNIQTPLMHSKWSNEFAEQVVWLGQQELKNAVIKINPQELGPLEISINMIKDSASITINSHSAQVREVLDQSLPRLREMMMQQGLNLAEVHIGSDSNSQTSTRQDSKSQEFHFSEIEEESILTSPTKSLSKGIIDYFA